MTTRNQVTALFRSFAGPTGSLVIPRPYIDLCDGDHLAALFLSQLLYWTERSNDTDGWVAKSYADWYDETALTERQIKRIIAGDKRRKNEGFALSSIGVETKLARSDYYGGAATLHYRVNTEVLAAKINEFSQVLTNGRNLPMVETANGQNDDPTNGQNDHIHRFHSNISSGADSDASESKPENDPVEPIEPPSDPTPEPSQSPEPKDDPVTTDARGEFHAIQGLSMVVVYENNPNKHIWGLAGDLANWALCQNKKPEIAEWQPEKPFSALEWEAFLLWYKAKNISFPKRWQAWNEQAHEFRSDYRAHMVYMARVTPMPVTSSVSDQDVDDCLASMTGVGRSAVA